MAWTNLAEDIATDFQSFEIPSEWQLVLVVEHLRKKHREHSRRHYEKTWHAQRARFRARRRARAAEIRARVLAEQTGRACKHCGGPIATETLPTRPARRYCAERCRKAAEKKRAASRKSGKS